MANMDVAKQVQVVDNSDDWLDAPPSVRSSTAEKKNDFSEDDNVHCEVPTPADKKLEECVIRVLQEVVQPNRENYDVMN